MASTSDLKNGMCIEFNNDLMKVIDFQHVKPGKGAAFVRTKLKSVTTGRVLENTFPSGANIVPIRIETRDYQFLYKDESGFNFMDNNTFEQINVTEDNINAPQFLKEGQAVMVTIKADNEQILSVDLPPTVTLEINYTEPGFKGNTASSSVNKKATLETGLEIDVPLFIEVGNKIKIDTKTGAYMERVK